MNCMNKNPMDSMIDSSYILTNALVIYSIVIKDPKTTLQLQFKVAAFKISDLIFLEDPKNIRS